MIACVLSCLSPDGHPNPATAGYMTCDKCAERLWSTLRTIARDYGELVGDPAHLLPAPGGPGPRRPGYGSTAPINLHVVAMTDYRAGLDGVRAISAPAVLGMWVRVIAEDTGAAWPSVTVAAMVDWLLNRWTWITKQPWVDQLAQECRELAGALAAQLRPRPPSAPPVGRCPIEVKDSVCGAPLYVRAGDIVIKCPRCGNPWPELGARTFDYGTLADLFARPLGTLRRWRAEDHWTRHGTEGRALWAHADVLASWQRRHGPTHIEERAG